MVPIPEWFSAGNWNQMAAWREMVPIPGGSPEKDRKTTVLYKLKSGQKACKGRHCARLCFFFCGTIFMYD
jgi:hypothetical protein